MSFDQSVVSLEVHEYIHRFYSNVISNVLGVRLPYPVRTFSSHGVVSSGLCTRALFPGCNWLF